ncbi:hypothetical protein PHPALM_31705 [Phytophthora palmivora]|uniref:Uncharacterized protein n=1 Tax=Phytophthora palmivora TaxID=4796 RepID=A0A2P4X1W5_9STRA|nr:hypothetical protein PHPALM_31705 [Phytophthora palmivora]
MAGDDAVYASILARVERSELRDQLHQVVRKEYKSISRQVRHASASLTALRQLQAASESLHPIGDWLPKRLQTRLKSIEKLQRRLETAVDHLEMDARGKKRKRRKRRTVEEDIGADEEDNEEMKTREPMMEEQESDVEFLGVKIPIRTDVGDLDEEKESGDVNEEVKRRELQVERAVQEEEMEEVESAASKDCGDVNADTLSDSDALPRGLVRVHCDTTVFIKEEPVFPDETQFDQEEPRYEVGADDIAESPIELEVLDSSDESAMELEVSDTEELATELEVPDSDSEDDFSFCVELVANLQSANALSQLAEFPAVVELLRTYLLDRKHLTVVDLDGYLFAHKRITDEEADEIGHAIETIIIIGMELPMRSKVKLALRDLLAIVEQLKLTLGGLPTFLCP